MGAQARAKGRGARPWLAAASSAQRRALCGLFCNCERLAPAAFNYCLSACTRLVGAAQGCRWFQL